MKHHFEVRDVYLTREGLEIMKEFKYLVLLNTPPPKLNWAVVFAEPCQSILYKQNICSQTVLELPHLL